LETSVGSGLNPRTDGVFWGAEGGGSKSSRSERGYWEYEEKSWVLLFAHYTN